MTIKITKPSSTVWQEYRDLTLKALQEEPNFLASSYQVALAKEKQDWQTFLENAASETEYILRFAINGDKLIGTARLSLEEPGCCYDHVGILGTLYVDPAYRRRGIATLIVSALLNVACEHSIKTIICYAREDNLTALSLCQKFGFELRGKLLKTARKSAGYVDELIFQKWIFDEF